jgi:hypothetical protein
MALKDRRGKRVSSTNQMPVERLDVAPSSGGSIDVFGRGSRVAQAKGSASTLTAKIAT